MNLWDHLGELRRRLLICIYVLLAGLVAGVFAVQPITRWLAEPVGRLVFIHPTEAFTAQIKIAVAVSFLMGLPIFLYQIWGFVASGLRPPEKRYFLWIIPSSYLFFMTGVAFSTFWVFPRAVGFLLTLKTDALEPMMFVEAYLDFFLLLALAFGILFQLPLVLHFLAKMGILKPEFLSKNRRVSYLIIFVVATLFNPVPEVLTQLVLACSAIALFESSIFLVKLETRKHPAQDVS